MKQNWKQIVEEMRRILDEVENDDKELAEALERTLRPELRQMLMVALVTLSDGRKIKGAAKATELDEEYLRGHLLPLLKEVLEDVEGR